METVQECLGLNNLSLEETEEAFYVYHIGLEKFSSKKNINFWFQVRKRNVKKFWVVFQKVFLFILFYFKKGRGLHSPHRIFPWGK